ncbi:hypothetical protein LXL04_022445 [Taraxacum kok-saghyz]
MAVVFEEEERKKTFCTGPSKLTDRPCGGWCIDGHGEMDEDHMGKEKEDDHRQDDFTQMIFSWSLDDILSEDLYRDHRTTTCTHRTTTCTHHRTTAGPPSVHHLHPSAHWTTDAPPPDHRRTTTVFNHK